MTVTAARTVSPSARLGAAQRGAAFDGVAAVDAEVEGTAAALGPLDALVAASAVGVSEAGASEAGALEASAAGVPEAEASEPGALETGPSAAADGVLEADGWLLPPPEVVPWAMPPAVSFAGRWVACRPTGFLQVVSLTLLTSRRAHNLRRNIAKNACGLPLFSSAIPAEQPIRRIRDTASRSLITEHNAADSIVMLWRCGVETCLSHPHPHLHQLAIRTSTQVSPCMHFGLYQRTRFHCLALLAILPLSRQFP